MFSIISNSTVSWYENDDSRYPGPSVGSVVWHDGRRVVITRVQPVGEHRFAGGRDNDYSHYDGYDCEGRPATAADVLAAAQAEACPWPRICRKLEETVFGINEDGRGEFIDRVTVSVAVEVSGHGTNKWGRAGFFSQIVWLELPAFNRLDSVRDAVASLDAATLPWRAAGDFAWLAELKSIRVTHGYAYCYQGKDLLPFYREYIEGPEEATA